MVIDMKDMVFSRGEDGQLLAKEVVLVDIEGSPTVKIKPLTRGKYQEIQLSIDPANMATAIEADKQTMFEGLVEPKMTEEDFKYLKPKYATAIATAIIAATLGISQEDIGKQIRGDLEGLTPDEIKKK